METRELLAAAIAQINIGIAMARSRGVVCGSPMNIRIVSRPTTGSKEKS